MLYRLNGFDKRNKERTSLTLIGCSYSNSFSRDHIRTLITDIETWMVYGGDKLQRAIIIRCYGIYRFDYTVVLANGQPHSCPPKSNDYYCLN